MHIFRVLAFVLALATGACAASAEEIILSNAWIVQAESRSETLGLLSKWNFITGEYIQEVTNFYSDGYTTTWFDNSGVWYETVEYANEMIFVSGLNTDGFYFRSFANFLDL